MLGDGGDRAGGHGDGPGAEVGHAPGQGLHELVELQQALYRRPVQHEDLHRGEDLIVAATEAIETGVPTWVSFTAGPDADLLGLDEIRAGAERVVALGAEAVLINCIPTRRVAEFLTAISDLGVPFGGYGNAGDAQDEVGFTASPIACDDYVAAARDWVAVGAGILGSCCGTGVAHVRALRTAFPP